MLYEIKQVSLTSILKVSFLVLLTVLSIGLMFFTLIIARMADFINTSLGEAGGVELLQNIDFNFTTIFFGSIFNGLFLTCVIVFILSLVIIFYNIYAKYIGGIKIEIERPINNNLVKTGNQNE
ncbi:MAG: DUF3566 domain-containing protein [Candidatus Marinimicrobia bacterium]|nr:DUF3566 domain-containing protein [Candidatus Neomarinimicrobiota bacterium]